MSLARHVERTLARIDAALEGRALVFGSPPPSGRDLDLLVRPPDEAVLTELLGAELGFVERKGSGSWALFAECSAFGVELVSAARWRLPAAELDVLYDEARPIDGFQRLVRPAPHHAVLVLARRLAGSFGRQATKLVPRVEEALREDPVALERAATAAPAWNATRAVALLTDVRAGRRPGAGEWLRAIGEADGTARVAASLARRPRIPVVVSLSGLDGSGKSSQAAALRDALTRLGVDTVVVWSPLGGNLTLELIGMPLKRLLRSLRFGPFTSLAERSASGHVMSKPGAEPPTGVAGAVTMSWATFVVLLNLLSQRRAVLRNAVRASVVVFDRHALDSAVRLRFLYGAPPRAPVHELLFRVAGPRPDLAFLLDVRPETSLARKQDEWSLEELQRQAELYRAEHAARGVRRLDGERPKDELCAEIAAAVWTDLR